MKWLICASVALALMATAQAREIVVQGPVHIPTLAPEWSTTDLRTGTPLPSGETTVNHVTVKWQIGNYWSDGLRIYGLLCTPTSLPAPYPVAILNHGLEWTTSNGQLVFPAIEANGLAGCTMMAGHGWLTAITTYRGEMISETINQMFVEQRRVIGVGGITPFPRTTTFTATSDGNLELCLGEVDDVLNLVSAVTALPLANSKHVLMWGHSHGSCITRTRARSSAARLRY